MGDLSNGAQLDLAWSRRERHAGGGGFRHRKGTAISERQAGGGDADRYRSATEGGVHGSVCSGNGEGGWCEWGSRGGDERIADDRRSSKAEADGRPYHATGGRRGSLVHHGRGG